MTKRFFYILTILNVTLSLFSADQRIFQLVGKEKNETFLSTELGSFSGFSLVSNRMQLSIGYSLLGMEGYSISTDLLLFEPILKNLSVHTGVGGGLIFKPDIENFTSFFYLRVPVKILYNNFLLQGCL